MELAFTLHARQRMKGRGVPETWVVETVTRPERLRIKGGKLYFQKRFAPGILEVCGEGRTTHINIINVYWV
jgi:hypothetical protein